MTGPAEVVIVGGGTAGWMAAAALSSMLGPGLCRVTLVESEEIGTVGVGEATLPHMRTFNEAIGLDEAEMMRTTNATFKLGIEFVDWGYKGSRYIHPFGLHGGPSVGLNFHHQWLRAAQSGHAFDIEDFSFAIAAARQRRFAFPDKDKSALGSTYDYAYQFDASRFAQYLRGFAEARGVKRVEGKIVDAALDTESGDVASVKLQSGEMVAGDLFIDCSGFRSLLLGETLGVGFEEWTKWLPCDRAFAVPSQRTADLMPITRSTAREAGWQWRIPLQHRTGNGHVFSSSFIGEDEAADTLMRNLDAEALGEPRLLRFKAGRRSSSWKRNCVALGLSSGFLEPLESTSIYLVQVGLMNFVQLFPGKRVDPRLAEEFNRRVDVEYERVRDFLILHYHLNSRDDGELWKYCHEMEVPESLTEKMRLFRHRGHIEKYKDGLFSPPSWLSVYLGQGLRPESHHPLTDAQPLDRLVQNLERLRAEIDAEVGRMPDHAAFIDRYCAAPGARVQAAS